MSDPFIGAAELAELQEVVDQGKATLQAYYDPPTIQLRRRNTTTEAFQDVYAPFRPISIRLANRLETETGANAGRVVITNGGTMEIGPDAPAIQRDDRFSLNGTPCVVTLVEPPKNLFGYRDVNFEYVGG